MGTVQDADLDHAHNAWSQFVKKKMTRNRTCTRTDSGFC